MLKLDRMFRNAGDCLTAVDKWERSGISLHVVDLGGNAIDTTSAAGRFMLVVLAGAAEMERNLTRERTRSAMAVKKANGQRVGSTPYGYDLADDGATLIENAAEQAVIREMKAMRAGGASFRAIAEELTRRGVPTKQSKSAQWSFQSVARILKRPSVATTGRCSHHRCMKSTCCQVTNRYSPFWINTTFTPEFSGHTLIHECSYQSLSNGVLIVSGLVK